MHLTLSLAGGSSGPGVPDARALQAAVRAAERGKLDAVLLGRWRYGEGKFDIDPLPLMGSMIGITQRIGLAASWTVDFTEPYHVARVFATLDHLSYGRSAWFVDMFGTERLLPLIGKPEETSDTTAYCARAGEFIDVVKALWDSWEDEGFALDKATGMFADPDRVHPIDHTGRFFTVRGPLNVPRPPQGTPPLIMRDPADDAARPFVARYADIILTDDASSEHVRALRALADGRDIRVLTNLRCILGETELRRRKRAAALRCATERRHPRVSSARQRSSLIASDACSVRRLQPADRRCRPADRCGDPTGPARRPGSHRLHRHNACANISVCTAHAASSLRRARRDATANASWAVHLSRRPSYRRLASSRG